MISREYFRTKDAAKILNLNRRMVARACIVGYLAHIKLNQKTIYIPDFEVYTVLRYILTVKGKKKSKRFNWKEYVEWREKLTSSEHL